MDCPACGKNLKETGVSDLKVDVCEQGCGGLWFDWFELKKVDEAHESAGESLLGVSGRAAPPARDKRRCPRCADAVMTRKYFTVRKEVEVDECAACGGVWLDAGELSAIRSEFKTEQERSAAADEHFSRLFNGQLAAAAGESAAEAERRQKFARAFKFVLPSHWIPGKQKGGAF